MMLMMRSPGKKRRGDQVVVAVPAIALGCPVVSHSITLVVTAPTAVKEKHTHCTL